MLSFRGTLLFSVAVVSCSLAKPCNDDACKQSFSFEMDPGEKWQSIIDALNSGSWPWVSNDDHYHQHSFMDATYNISDGNIGNTFNFEEMKIDNVSEYEWVTKGVIISRDKGVFEEPYEMLYVTDFKQYGWLYEFAWQYQQWGEGKVLWRSPESPFVIIGNTTVTGTGTIRYESGGTFSVFEEYTEIMVMEVGNQTSSRTVSISHLNGETVEGRDYLEGIQVFTTEENGFIQTGDSDAKNEPNLKPTKMSTTMLDVQVESPSTGNDGQIHYHCKGTVLAEGSETSLMLEGSGFSWNNVESSSSFKGMQTYRRPRVPRSYTHF